MRSFRLWLLLALIAPGLTASALFHVVSVWYAAGHRLTASSLPIARAVAGVVSVASRTAGPPSLMMYQGYVAQATVLVLKKSCTGFVASEPNLIVTAAHCVPEGVRQVPVLTAQRKRYVTRVIRLDRNSDLALLRLPRPLDIPPLFLATNLPDHRPRSGPSRRLGVAHPCPTCRTPSSPASRRTPGTLERPYSIPSWRWWGSCTAARVATSWPRCSLSHGTSPPKKR